MANSPSHGDVLITTEGGRHLLSVVPHPHKISFKELSRAVDIAMQWARANRAEVWRKVNGETFRVVMDDQSDNQLNGAADGR